MTNQTKTIKQMNEVIRKYNPRYVQGSRKLKDVQNLYQSTLELFPNEKEKVTCYNCGEKVDRKDTHLWYHGDQDDLICTECAKITKHTDTCYAGSKVLE